MKLFNCQKCGQLVYFENTLCEVCSSRLAFLATRKIMVAIEPQGENWTIIPERGASGQTSDGGAETVPERESFRLCANAEFDACNWLIPLPPTEAAVVEGEPPAEPAAERFCLACRHNKTIPDVGLPENLAKWRQLEQAKHRLFYALLRLDLPLATRTDDPENGLAFEFLAAVPDQPKVLTGHDHGLITLALNEADEVERARARLRFGETYRTLLGHFRHEVGHYYWDVLVRDTPQLEPFRRLFGDERQDYAEALRRHYENGPPTDRPLQFISHYASSHPWEDFAETWAHYLHIVDTLETGFAFGLHIAPALNDAGDLHSRIDFDPYAELTVDRIATAWLPLVYAVNCLNRSMGQPDLYPFVITPEVIGKLGFIHDLVRGHRAAG